MTGLSILALVAFAGSQAALAAGVVTTCDEAHLDTALSGGGLVTFNCGGAAAITVTSTKTITADTTIDGGSLITISGGNAVGVFSVSTGVAFTVQNLTIANGYSASAAGGIQNAGTLTVTKCSFSGNRSTAGGAIVSFGTLTVTDSTFSGNEATGLVFGTGFDNGGGILGGGTLTVTNSTFVGNYAAGNGGGIANGGSLTVVNSTFSGNIAGSDGGGGIANFGMLTATNTIVANTKSGGNCSGVITDGGHNLDSDGTCGVGPATAPLLAPALADNGGPTQTIALQADSPAINAGDESVCAALPVNNLDQRGYVRPGAGATRCSIGAYEYNASPSVPTPTPMSSATVTPARTITPTSTATATQTPTKAQCMGDCDGSGEVTVDEIIILVSIDLGTADTSACPSGIPSGTEVDIALIVQAVNNTLTECPAP